ncbi:MAG: hypothetical protein GY711_26925 [bacterium]|nr:hypothetical protein [bacterium]
MLFLAALLSLAVQDPTDDELRSAWKKLPDASKREVAEWFSAEAGYLDTFQQKLINHVMQSQDRDPFDWPDAEPPPIYDPTVHAPAQPIARKRMNPKGRRYDKFKKTVFRKVPERKLISSWAYDYASRSVVRTSKASPKQVFENALHGFPPNVDLVEALVEQSLDDGVQQEVLAALGHAYSDRAGNTYGDITLYDVWGSGVEMEMPDVECLGIVHDLLDDWRTWVAPVRASQHDALYEKIGNLFVDARRHRGLRHAFARLYVSGKPAQRDGYGPHVDRFHALWDVHASTPEKLAPVLPAPDDWAEWLEKEGKRVDTSRKLYTAGQKRHATLAADSARVRATLVRVMREIGALKKDE